MHGPRASRVSAGGNDEQIFVEPSEKQGCYFIANEQVALGRSLYSISVRVSLLAMFLTHRALLRQLASVELRSD